MDYKKIINEQARLRIFQVKDIEKVKQRKNQYVCPIDVKQKKLGEKGNFSIFLVDGYLIRHFIDFDFTMGGHGLRYVYVPMNEIWVDDANIDEKDEIIAHELNEFRLMKKGLNYDEAHNLSSIVEVKVRNNKLILPVGHYRQKRPWTCGPSALKIILDYYDDKRSEEELIKGTECNPDFPTEGTLHKGFIKMLKKLNYKYKEKENAKIEDVEYYIQKGMPVIVDYQAYHGGHFSVIVGYDDERILLSDPAYDKKFKWIQKEDFEKRWFEEDEPGKIVKSWLLAVYPKK